MISHVHYYLIFHNTPCLPPKILQKHCLPISLGTNVTTQEKWKNKGYAKFCGVNMVYYRRCANGKFVYFVMTLKLNECHATVNWNVWVLHKQLGTPGSVTPFCVLKTAGRLRLSLLRNSSSTICGLFVARRKTLVFSKTLLCFDTL